MAVVRTGYIINPQLKKVVDGGPNDGEPLDVNNQLCSVSGLPQDMMANSPSNPNYRVEDLTACTPYYIALDNYVTAETAEDACSLTFNVDDDLYTVNPTGILDVGDVVYIFGAEEQDFVPFALFPPLHYASYLEGGIRYVIEIDT